MADWRDSLPDDLKTSPALKDTADVPALAKQFVDLQSHLGQSLRIPSKEAGAEDLKTFYGKVMERVPGLIVRPDLNDPVAKNAFYDMTGRPKDEKGYALPDKVILAPETEVVIRKAAHASGLNNDQFKSLVTSLNEIGTASATKAKEKLASDSAVLDAEWGLKREHNTKLVKAIATATGAPAELLNSIDRGEVAPSTMKWLLGIASKFPGEGADIINQGGGSNNTMTPQEARNRIIEIRANKQHPVWNSRDPMHAASVDDWANLHKYANAG